MNTIDTIINEITQHIHGSSCIPETYEAAFVTAVWKRAQTLEDPLRAELLCRTSVTQDSVKQIREEAADALEEAHRALYGPARG